MIGSILSTKQYEQVILPIKKNGKLTILVTLFKYTKKKGEK